MDGLSDKVRKGIRDSLAGSPKVRRAVLFGSRAMGCFRPASDVDLALEGEGLVLEDLIHLKGRLGYLDLPIEVDLVIRSSIRSADLEEHIRTRGVEWYRREEG